MYLYFVHGNWKVEGYSKAHIPKEVIGRLITANYYHCIHLVLIEGCKHLCLGS